MQAAALAVLLFMGAAAHLSFEVVPLTVLEQGKGKHHQLADWSAKESFLDRMLGTNCFSQALLTVNSECTRLSTGARYRLALQLLNCHQRQLGGRQYPCAPRQTVQQCTVGMSDRDHGALTEFLTNAQSMCLFVRNQDFQRHTEHLINSLHTSTSQAAQTLDSVSATLDQQQARTDAMAGRMETLSADQAQLGSGIQQGLSQLAALQNASQQLDSGLAATLQRTTSVLESQAELAAQVAEQGQAHAAHSRQAHDDLQALHEQADALGHRLKGMQEVHDQMGDSLRVLTEHGDKLLDLLHTANSSLQRISTSVTWLLGSQLRWSAKAFYLLSCLLAFGICQQRRFSRAFWPIMALSLGSIAAERWLAGSHFGLGAGLYELASTALRALYALVSVGLLFWAAASHASSERKRSSREHERWRLAFEAYRPRTGLSSEEVAAFLRSQIEAQAQQAAALAAQAEADAESGSPRIGAKPVRGCPPTEPVFFDPAEHEASLSSSTKQPSVERSAANSAGCSNGAVSQPSAPTGQQQLRGAGNSRPASGIDRKPQGAGAAAAVAVRAEARLAKAQPAKASGAAAASTITPRRGLKRGSASSPEPEPTAARAAKRR